MTVVNKPRIVIGAAALAGLTALGGVGAMMNNDPAAVNGASAARIDVTHVATTSSKPGTDAAATLMGMLPAGYDSSNCSTADEGLTDALATVDCGQNSLSNGPTAARFALFADQQTMDGKFDVFVSEDKLSPCPGGADSPGTWSYNANADDVAGQIACGTYQGTPDLTWTQNAELVLGNIQGNDLDSLYGYWSHPSDSNQAAPARR